jgi:hypothetical protein
MGGVPLHLQQLFEVDPDPDSLSMQHMQEYEE